MYHVDQFNFEQNSLRRRNDLNSILRFISPFAVTVTLYNQIAVLIFPDFDFRTEQVCVSWLSPALPSSSLLHDNRAVVMEPTKGFLGKNHSQMISK